MKKLRKLIIYTDGGARGNPGPAGIGIVIMDQENHIIKQYNKYISKTTNNQAEYQAVVKGLELVKNFKPEEVELRLDSELVVNQLNMQFKIKNSELGPHFIKIWNLRQLFKKVVFKYVPREQNTLADQLVNKAIDQKGMKQNL